MSLEIAVKAIIGSLFDAIQALGDIIFTAIIGNLKLLQMAISPLLGVLDYFTGGIFNLQGTFNSTMDGLITGVETMKTSFDTTIISWKESALAGVSSGFKAINQVMLDWLQKTKDDAEAIMNDLRNKKNENPYSGPGYSLKGNTGITTGNPVLDFVNSMKGKTPNSSSGSTIGALLGTPGVAITPQAAVDLANNPSVLNMTINARTDDPRELGSIIAKTVREELARRQIGG
jgi:hypothetical protein